MQRSTTNGSSRTLRSWSTSATRPARTPPAPTRSGSCERRAAERPVSARVGVAGLGHWGPNLARNFAELADLAWLCDADPAKRELASRYPQARWTDSFDEMLGDPELEAVVIATPVPTHYELARRTLESGRHVLVEKPPAMRGHEMDELVALAAVRELVLMPGHLHLLDPEPAEGVALGRDFLTEGVEDVVFCYLRFPSGKIAHMHLSWLDPHKMRKMTVVGTEKMAVFDDMELERKVTVYEKAPWKPAERYGEWQTRTGDIWSPRISNDEPLKLECLQFLALVAGEGDRRRAADDGARVVRT